MNSKHIAACFVLCLGLPAHGFADMVELKEPALAFPDSFSSSARAKVTAALRRSDCTFLGGTSFNAGTQLRYAGETVPLNLFMESLVACPGITLSFRFHYFPEDAGLDWTLMQDGFDPQRLCVVINLRSTRLKLDALVVPDNHGPAQEVKP